MSISNHVPTCSFLLLFVKKFIYHNFIFFSLIEKGGDWDRRNRLKVYHGLYYLSIRDFKNAAENFLESISTFTSYELMDYKNFVIYTVLTSMIALPRTELREKVRSY